MTPNDHLRHPAVLPLSFPEVEGSLIAVGQDAAPAVAEHRAEEPERATADFSQPGVVNPDITLD